jgi:hypothetical protein
MREDYLQQKWVAWVVQNTHYWAESEMKLRDSYKP